MAGAQGVRAGRAFVEIGADPREFQRALKNLQKGIGELGRNLQMAGGTLMAAGAAIVGSIAGASAQFAATGDAVAKMSARTGIGVEALSAMSFAAEQSGADLATFEKGVRRMQSTLNDASMGMASATDSLSALGLQVADLQGLSPDKQFEILANALAGVEDASQRAALAQRIFGRAGTALLPLMSAGAGGFAALRAEAERLGLIMDADTAKQAEVLTDAMNSLRRGIGAVVFQIGSAVAPVFSDLSQQLSNVAGGVARFIRQNQQLVNRVLKVAATVTVAGGAIFGLGTALRVAAFGFGGIASAASALIQPLRLVAAGLAGVVVFAAQAVVAITVYAAQSIAAAAATTAAWVIANAPIVAIGVAIAGIGLAAVQLAGGFRAVGQAAASALQPIAGWAGAAGASIGTAFGTMLSDAKTVFSDLYSTAATTFGGISDALAMGDFAAAGEIAWLGLQAVWQRGVAAIMSYTDPFVEYLQNVWGNVSTFTLNVVDSLFTNLQAGFRTGFAVIQGVVDNVINGIVGTFDALVTTIRVMWTRVQGLITGAKDTEQRVSQIRDEASARAEQRQQERPGIAGRLEAAAETNAEGQSDLQARQDRRIGDNADAQSDRASRTDERSAERQKAINETNVALEEKRAELAERRAELDAQVAASGAAGADGAGGEQLALAGGATPSRSEVAGTFSAAAVGGLGIGSSVMDRIAKASEETAKNTAAFAAQEVVE